MYNSRFLSYTRYLTCKCKIYWQHTWQHTRCILVYIWYAGNTGRQMCAKYQVVLLCQVRNWLRSAVRTLHPTIYNSAHTAQTRRPYITESAVVLRTNTKKRIAEIIDNCTHTGTCIPGTLVREARTAVRVIFIMMFPVIPGIRHVGLVWGVWGVRVGRVPQATGYTVPVCIINTRKIDAFFPPLFKTSKFRWLHGFYFHSSTYSNRT